jgi:hypothetical protein
VQPTATLVTLLISFFQMAKPNVFTIGAAFYYALKSISSEYVSGSAEY